MIFLGIFLLLCEILRYLEFRHLIVFLKKEKTPDLNSPPPKPRGSFVVKRMEEKLKQALYPEE